MLRRRALAFAALLCIVPPAAAQNSTRKDRPEPSASAAEAGTAVPWRGSVADALKESALSGKPVFWYVPTVRRSPMDRQVELDRYMLFGPFSWPQLAAVLAEFFVPVRAVPDAAQAKRYELRPGAFIEPGYLVLNGDGSERARLDQITTFHLGWFLRRVIESLPDDARGRATRLVPPPFGEVPTTDRDVTPLTPSEERAIFDLYGATRPGAAGFPGPTLDAAPPARAHLQAKIEAEREGHGPLRFGFEVPFVLPDAVLDGEVVRGTLAPADVYDAAALRSCGVRFFAWMQHDDGGFTDSRYDFGGTDSMPNVWSAVTALAGRAMLDVGPRLADAEESSRAAEIAARAFDYLSADEHLNFEDSDELAWALIYRARFARDWMDRRDDRVDEAQRMLTYSLGRLLQMQASSGTWYHEYANPFVTASALLAIAEAERAAEGFRFSAAPELIARGLGALRRCRTAEGAISYGDTRSGSARAAVAGSVGRMPVVAHALGRFDPTEQGALARAIERAFEFHDEMDAVRKYDDHASRLGYGGFFFWYGMHGRAEAIADLPAGAAKDGFKARLRAQVLALPEIDGCFVDSHELGRVYGTAMALLCLGRTEPE